MSKQNKRLFEFGPFRLDPAKRTLLRDGDLVPLPPKVLDILQVLVENSGEIVEKEELMQRLWPDTFVEEGNLSVNIFALRKALNQDGDRHQYIKTIPRRGYCFVAGVTEITPEPPPDDRPTPMECGDLSVLSSRNQGSDKSPRSIDVAAHTAVIERGQGWRARHPALATSVLLLSLAMVMVAFGPASLSKRAVTGAQAQSLAVLPFKTIGAESGDDYLGPGMADALVTTLSNLNQLTVRPLRASLKYDGAGQDAIEAGRALRVDAVLEGSLRRAGKGLRLTARLVRVRDGSRLWEARFTQEFASILAARHAVSAQVAQALAVELTGREKEWLAKRQTGSAEAYELYLKGRYLTSQKPSRGVQDGFACFEQATRIDPRFALAYAEMALSQFLLADPQTVIERLHRAKATALQALAVDETVAEAHTALGRAVTFCDWDWAGAEREYQRAIELNPSYAEAHYWYAHNLSALGRHEEAIAEMKLIQESDPFSTRNNLHLAWTHYLARRYDESIAQLRQTPLELDSAYYQIYWRLGLVYAQQAKHEEAIDMLRKASGLSGDRPLAKASLGYVYAKSGRRAEAQQILDELGEIAKRKTFPSITLASVYSYLGDHDQAFEWLERAYAQREGRLMNLRVEPMLDGLRADPRYEALARRMALTR